MVTLTFAKHFLQFLFAHPSNCRIYHLYTEVKHAQTGAD
jgi:hypothetical protein